MEHPTGIEPWGNFYMRGGGPNIRDAGLGDLSVINDALLLEILGCGVLRAVDLGRLALTSKALYCFTNLEELWKGMVIEELGGHFTWCGTWQQTYLVSSRLVQEPERGTGGDGLVEGASEVSGDDEQQSEVEGEDDEDEDDDDDEEDDQGEEEELDGRCSKRRRRELSSTTLSEMVCRNDELAAKRMASNCCNGAAVPTTCVAEEEAEEVAEPGPASTAALAEQTASRRRGCGSIRLTRRIPRCGRQRYLRVKGFYSDLLYQPWYCATLKLPYEWLEVDNIDRRSGLTPEQFRLEYEMPNRPVVMQDVMCSWPAMAKWNRQYLEEVFGQREVIVGDMPMTFTNYLSYSSSNRDEMPLYLFDKHFTAVAPSLEADYNVPPHFGEDLFGFLGEQGRPDYRWLILGPRRSGSSFHVDPNSTSAWNALLWGAKKWILYPPGVVPPGVHPSPDGADVATPLSLIEWFVNFYAATREGKVRPVEFVARPGDLLFVPRGWWHCALNLEESCALTQNFVSELGLSSTLAFLKSRRPELVSGCAHESRCNLYDRFVAALRQHRPKVLATVEARQQHAKARAEHSNRLAALFRAPEPAHCNSIYNGLSNGNSCNVHGNGRYNGSAAEGDKLDAGKAGGCGGGDSVVANSGGDFSFGFGFGSGSTGPAVIAAADAAPPPVAGTSMKVAGFKFGFSL